MLYLKGFAGHERYRVHQLAGIDPVTSVLPGTQTALPVCSSLSCSTCYVTTYRSAALHCILPVIPIHTHPEITVITVTPNMWESIKHPLITLKLFKTWGQVYFFSRSMRIQHLSWPHSTVYLHFMGEVSPLYIR